MKEFKGSETPWAKVFTSIGNKRAVRCNGYIIATLNPPTKFSGQDLRYDRDLERYSHDHNLITAAPDLFEALQILLFDYESICKDYKTQPSWFIARDAIKKSLGIDPNK